MQFASIRALGTSGLIYLIVALGVIGLVGFAADSDLLLNQAPAAHAILFVCEPEGSCESAGPDRSQCMYVVDMCGDNPECLGPVSAAPVACDDPKCNYGPCRPEPSMRPTLPPRPTPRPTTLPQPTVVPPHCPYGTVQLCPMCAAGTPPEQCRCTCTALPRPLPIPTHVPSPPVCPVGHELVPTVCTRGIPPQCQYECRKSDQVNRPEVVCPVETEPVEIYCTINGVEQVCQQGCGINHEKELPKSAEKKVVQSTPAAVDSPGSAEALEADDLVNQEDVEPVASPLVERARKLTSKVAPTLPAAVASEEARDRGAVAVTAESETEPVSTPVPTEEPTDLSLSESLAEPEQQSAWRQFFRGLTAWLSWIF